MTAQGRGSQPGNGAKAPANVSGGSEYAGTNPWLIAIIVSAATFMEVLDTTIANVVLRYISGSLGVGPSEAAWVVTSYLVANSIVLCASSWLVQVFGRKNFFLACIALFTVSSFLCGIAWSLPALLVFRVMQGLAGGGMTPVAQSILAAAFPPAKRSQGFAIYGVAVVVAPAIGPVLGGWLADAYSWHWCFFINVPIGIASLVSIVMLLPASKNEATERRKLWKNGLKFDAVGFILVATFLGALEVVLDKGQEDDWFGSGFIIAFAATSATALVLFIPWELMVRKPLIDLRMLVGRQFGACFLVMLGTGAILIATTQFLPQLLQTNYGYTATLSGLALSPGGVVTMLGMFVVGRLGFIQPKYLIAAGGLVIAAAMYDLTRIDADVDFGFFAWSRIYVAIGLPLLFIPVTTASYDGLPTGKTDQASALINVARNFGGSIGVSLAQTVLARREQFHQARLSEHVGTWNPAYQQSLQQFQNYFATKPVPGTSTSQTAVASIGQMVELQSSFLAYIDVFFVLMLVAGVVAALALTLRSVKPGGAVQGAA
ncbi:DHA2 family efflux MFS transporter permease subunit [Lichenifustis flavocetrariae]|uniref:DHA2 family efflux MFS transporter permease subunit n=1 Tax=Lichenifustis flavocetrariae TaxID=2949735 RepID=A0AA41YTR5_9HYPH|nr:DHA2 family efflux MFS transporter permease subunit [Lichenifustis flavocetrariae]MCW6507061.1 DHA2 family efflux MFS transporter permease subunit [Lichenifustis flavocetrariae]